MEQEDRQIKERAQRRGGVVVNHHGSSCLSRRRNTFIVHPQGFMSIRLFLYSFQLCFCFFQIPWESNGNPEVRGKGI